MPGKRSKTYQYIKAIVNGTNGKIWYPVLNYDNIHWVIWQRIITHNNNNYDTLVYIRLNNPTTIKRIETWINFSCKVEGVLLSRNNEQFNIQELSKCTDSNKVRHRNGGPWICVNSKKQSKTSEKSIKSNVSISCREPELIESTFCYCPQHIETTIKWAIDEEVREFAEICKFNKMQVKDVGLKEENPHLQITYKSEYSPNKNIDISHSENNIKSVITATEQKYHQPRGEIQKQLKTYILKHSRKIVTINSDSYLNPKPVGLEEFCIRYQAVANKMAEVTEQVQVQNHEQAQIHEQVQTQNHEQIHKQIHEQVQAQIHEQVQKRIQEQMLIQSSTNCISNHYAINPVDNKNVAVTDITSSSKIINITTDNNAIINIINNKPIINIIGDDPVINIVTAKSPNITIVDSTQPNINIIKSDIPDIIFFGDDDPDGKIVDALVHSMVNHIITVNK